MRGADKKSPPNGGKGSPKGQKRKKKKMNKTDMIKLAKAVATANRKLAAITAGGLPRHYDEVEVSTEERAFDVVVRAGGSEIASEPRDGDVEKLLDALWAHKDGVEDEYHALLGLPKAEKKAQKAQKVQKPQATAEKKAWPINGPQDFLREVNHLLEVAQRKLDEVVTKADGAIVAGEVRFAVTHDGVGIYVMSGSRHVATVALSEAREESFKPLREAVWAVVDGLRDGVSRRKALCEQMELLRKEDAAAAEAEEDAADLKELEESLPALEEAVKVADEASAKALLKRLEGMRRMIERAKAKAAKKTASVVDAAVKTAVVGAVNKAVAAANQELGSLVIDPSLGEATLTVSGFAGGIVVIGGNEPLYVTVFPKTGVATDMMVKSIEASVAGAAKQHKRQLLAAQAELSLANRLKGLDAAVAEAMAEYKSAKAACM